MVGWRPGGGVSRVANGLRRTLARGAEVMSDRHASLLAGLTLGDDRDQPADMTDAFRAAGLTHILAVSGQNVAFVMVLVAPVLARLRFGPRLVVTLAVLAGFALGDAVRAVGAPRHGDGGRGGHRRRPGPAGLVPAGPGAGSRRHPAGRPAAGDVPGLPAVGCGRGRDRRGRGTDRAGAPGPSLAGGAAVRHAGRPVGGGPPPGGRVRGRSRWRRCRPTSWPCRRPVRSWCGGSPVDWSRGWVGLRWPRPCTSRRVPSWPGSRASPPPPPAGRWVSCGRATWRSWPWPPRPP